MQVVDYVRSGHDPGPALVLADGDDLVREPLTPGTTLAYGLGERRCAGTLADGEHVACEVPAAPYCDAHTHTWVCARCTGTCLKPEMDCHQDHALYLAAVPPESFKVGVTRLERLETRLREQGAVRAAHLRTLADGRIARELEAELAASVPDRIRAPTKIAGLHRDVDEAAWQERLATPPIDEFEPTATYAFEYGLDLDAAPVPETTAAGTVRGVQGRLLLLEEHGTVYAVDMRDLLGYELTEGGADGGRQASFGAFS